MIGPIAVSAEARHAPAVLFPVERDALLNQQRFHAAPVDDQLAEPGGVRQHATTPLNSRSHTDPVTRRNVAGMDVSAGSELLFCSVESTSHSFCSSDALPLPSAAANPFIDGP